MSISFDDEKPVYSIGLLNAQASRSYLCQSKVQLRYGAQGVDGSRIDIWMTFAVVLLDVFEVGCHMHT